MSDKDNEYYLTESTSALAQKATLEASKENKPVGVDASTDPSVVNARYATEDTDTSGYIGVSEEYMTHADDTQMPLNPTEGVEAELLEQQLGGLAYSETPKVEVPNTLGTGSSVESIYTATSGEDFTSKVIDRETVNAEQEKLTEDATDKDAPFPSGPVPTPEVTPEQTDTTVVGGTPPPSQPIS